jgi:hypothetical protein
MRTLLKNFVVLKNFIGQVRRGTEGKGLASCRTISTLVWRLLIQIYNCTFSIYNCTFSLETYLRFCGDSLLGTHSFFNCHTVWYLTMPWLLKYLTAFLQQERYLRFYVLFTFYLRFYSHRGRKTYFLLHFFAIFSCIFINRYPVLESAYR